MSDWTGCDIGRDYNPYRQCDGTAACPRHGEYARGVADGVADERARVVADLRALARNSGGNFEMNNFLRAALRIERGDHEEAIPNILIFGFPPVNP